MNSKLLRTILCAGCIAAAGLTALAGPLRRADVPADPAWLVHLDCDAFRATAIGQVLQSQLDRPEVQARLAAFQAVFNLDLRSQLHGATLYGAGADHSLGVVLGNVGVSDIPPAGGAGTDPSQGVVLVYADFDADRLVTLAKAAKDAKNTAYNQHVIYSWADDKRPVIGGVKPRVYASIAGARIVFGQRQDRVSQALDVLDGTAQGLASSAKFPLLGAPGDASFFEAAARKMDVPGTVPNANILRLSKSIRIQVAEAQQQFTATCSLEANDQEVANQMISIGQGLVALMKLQTDRPEAAKLANAIAISQDAAQVTATFSMPSSDVIDILKAVVARRAANQPAAAKP